MIADVGRHNLVNTLILLRTKSSTPAEVTATTGISAVTPLAQAPLPDIGSHLTVMKDALRRKERNGFIPPTDYIAVAQVAGTTAVVLDVCVDRNRPHGIDPGTYTGVVTIGDRRVSSLDVPITIRVQQRSWLLTIFVTALIVLLGGTVFVYASGQGQGLGEAGVKSLFESEGRRQISGWVQANIVPMCAGIAAGSVAFVANAWNDPAWGWNAPTQWFTLLGVTFAAYTAALSAGSAKFASKSHKSSPDPNATAPAQAAPTHSAVEGSIVSRPAGQLTDVNGSTAVSPPL